MIAEKKWREFWVILFKKNGSIIDCRSTPHPIRLNPATDDQVHVIEYAAYNDAREECILLTGGVMDLDDKLAAAQKEIAKYKSVLNKIAIAGSGAMAYTKDFTEFVNNTAREALNSQPRWPY